MEPRIILLAHTIRSLWNVGSLFRTSDAFGVEKLILSGYTATPPRREISKTAIGAEESVQWEYIEEPTDTLKKLQEDGWSLVALEQTDTAKKLSNYEPTDKVCIVLGHEVSGISQELLDLCDTHVEIPMHGMKESINVSVATGIILNHIRNNS